MSSLHDNENIISRLQERIDYLEEVNRWHTFSIETLVSMLDIHSDSHKNRDAGFILQTTHTFIDRLDAFETVAFFLIDEGDSSFNMVECSPTSERSDIQLEVDKQIENGTFAWAINQNNAVMVKADRPDHQLILHVISTRSRVRGMFVALLGEAHEKISHSAMNLLSIILSNTAYALESSALYKLINEHNEHLEEMVEQRTQELAYQAGHDSLTGLPNRLLFMDRVTQSISHCQKSGRKCAVLLFDLDLFKRVNDTFGHGVGDSLLQAVAERLSASSRSTSIYPRYTEIMPSVSISRLGGDEFSFLISDLNNVHDSIKVIQRIIESVSVPFHIEGHEIFLTASVGVSAFPGDGGNAAELLKNAETAMYHAKQHGRNDYEFYAQEMNARAFEHLILENQLRHAVERDEFTLFYQPQINLKSGKVVAIEALIRWNQPEIGMISPMQFIPVAEETGLIIPIGEWVLNRACDQLSALHKLCSPDLRVAVNLSAYQFKQHNLTEVVTATLERTGLPARCLELEITESALMEDMSGTVLLLETLHKIGVQISIDDFGTGYSSLNYLKTFPLDTLKIDQGFVRDMLSDEQDQAIVSTIIALADNLKLTVIAEGVEEEAHVEFLRDKQCHIAQGYFFSRPIPFEELTEYLKKSS